MARFQTMASIVPDGESRCFRSVLRKKGVTMRFARFVICLIVCLGFVGTSGHAAQDSRVAWKKIVKKCADSDLLGDSVLYFGVSNTLGPGTVFKPVQGGYQPRWQFKRYVDNPDDLIVPGAPISCEGTSATKFKFGTAASASATLGVQGDLAATVGSAKKVKVSATGVEWKSLEDGPWSQ